MTFFSSDDKFGLILTEDITMQLTQQATLSFPYETGGILIGKYSGDFKNAEVKIISTETNDSKKGPTWYHRGTRGLRQLLTNSWENNGWFYLGEWHSHPKGTPQPSFPDKQQMVAIAASDRYVCPEPILLIIAGKPANWSYGAYVFPKGKFITLNLRRDSNLPSVQDRTE